MAIMLPRPLVRKLLRLLKPRGRPFMVADGIGVDSTALLILLKELDIRPDAILFADTKSEKDETYEYIHTRRAWLRRNNFPQLTVVCYRVQDYRHWPPYSGLAENCLTNGTLPSLAFGFKSCSLKWKVAPQNAWAKTWPPALHAWAKGRRVLKAIGYDASPKDQKRYAQAVGMEDPLYDYVYPLMVAGWDRERCKEMIRAADEPVPPKSARYMCPATQTEELHEHKKKYLRWIVVMEARAKPRLEGHIPQVELDRIYKTETLPAWEKKCAEAAAAGRTPPKKPRHPQNATGVLGLWRRGRKGLRGGKKMPGMMTDYIREHGLLPADEIDEISRNAPKDIIDSQEAFANGLEIPSWHDFLEQFTDEDDDCCTDRPEAVLQIGRDRLSAPLLADPMAVW